MKRSGLMWLIALAIAGLIVWGVGPYRYTLHQGQFPIYMRHDTWTGHVDPCIWRQEGEPVECTRWWDTWTISPVFQPESNVFNQFD